MDATCGSSRSKAVLKLYWVKTRGKKRGKVRRLPVRFSFAVGELEKSRKSSAFASVSGYFERWSHKTSLPFSCIEAESVWAVACGVGICCGRRDWEDDGLIPEWRIGSRDFC
jgi:hypothetical protein